VTTNSNEPQSKKPYAPPRLAAYGSVTKLTQGGSGSGADLGGAGMSKMCL
jgi:hypothetical protein